MYLFRKQCLNRSYETKKPFDYSIERKNYLIRLIKLCVSIRRSRFLQYYDKMKWEKTTVL